MNKKRKTNINQRRDVIFWQCGIMVRRLKVNYIENALEKGSSSFSWAWNRLSKNVVL
jgi:hypothetical protein